jgi:hypothetical protein
MSFYITMHSVLALLISSSQITLWSMAKSPLMFGGDVRKLDETTYNLITNPTLLEINSFSSNNMEACVLIYLCILWENKISLKIVR